LFWGWPACRSCRCVFGLCFTCGHWITLIGAICYRIFFRHRRFAFRLCGKEGARDPYCIYVFSLSSFFFRGLDFVAVSGVVFVQSYTKGAILLDMVIFRGFLVVYVYSYVYSYRLYRQLYGG